MSKLDELFGERIKENTLNSTNHVLPDTEKDIEIKKIDRVLTIGLSLLILIVPLIVRAHFGDFVSPQVTGTDMDTGVKSDIFTYYKFVVLVIGTVLLGMIFLYKVFAVGYVIPKSKLNILVGIFTITIILSAVFSPNKTVALFGMYNRHDGTISYLCYIALFFIAANIRYTSKSIKWIIYSIVPFVIINAVLGLLLLYGKDVFQWDWVNRMVFGNLPDGSEINEGSKFWSTLNNPNYISGFAGCLTALFFTLAVLKENLVEKGLLLVISLASFSVILTSLSTSGFVIFIIALLLILIFAIISKSKIKNLSVYMVGIIGFSLILNIYAIKNPIVWQESVGFFISKNPYTEIQKSIGLLEDISIESTVSAAENDFKLKELPSYGVSAGSGRVYIWGKTIKLISDKPLLGYGLDTFAYHFPQDDPEKISGLGKFNIITDKPHNLFMGLAYGAGIISAISLIFLIGFILIKWLINLFKGKGSHEFFAVGIMIISFVFQAMFNDSIIGFTNTIFILLGVLVSLLIYNDKKNLIIRRK